MEFVKQINITGIIMYITISSVSNVPIYLQILNQIKKEIALGRLKPNEKLPTVRELAQQLLINPNTILKIYLELEREKIVYTKKGTGTFVAENILKKNTTEGKLKIQDLIEQAYIESMHLQINADEFEKICIDKIKKLKNIQKKSKGAD